MRYMDRAYKVQLAPDGAGWTASIPEELPGCFSQGDSREDALRNIRGAAELHLESLIDDGQVVPPASEWHDVNVNAS